MTTLMLNCLGGFTFVQDGLPILGLKSKKGQALLCYLAVSGKRVSRSALAGMFWMDMPESLALMNLRKVINRIKPLASFLLIDHRDLAFNRNSSYWLDVQEFDGAAADRSDIQRLKYAVTLYSGDFLEGFDCDEVPSFAAWVESQRTRLREALIDCLKILIRDSSEHGIPLDAIQFARQWLKIEAWNEEAHRELMRLLSLSGQRSEALKQYEICRRILKEELAVEPAPATLHLLQQISAGELAGNVTGPAQAISSAIPQPVHSLPPLTAPLIGRQQELATLKIYLSDPQIRLVSIAGAGGMGKTQLALSLAHDIAAGSPWFKGVFFVPLEAVTTRQHLIMAMSAPLSLALSGARDPEKLLLSYLMDKNYLIVLDNFEQLLPEADFLAKILTAAPGCKLMITTRERTKLLQEWVLDLFGLPYSEDMEDVQLTDTDSVRLFMQCARHRSADFSLEKNIKAVVRICQLVQGMPLALELAASWTRVMTAAEIGQQIAQNILALTGELRNLPPRHRSMRAMLDSSWHWLNPEEQTVMRKLSVFRAGFNFEGGKQVAGASLSVLSALVDKSFVNLNSRSSETSRYEIHELIRQYADGQLETSGEAEMPHNLHLNYFLALAEQAERYWDTAQEEEWLQHLELERGNLHTALHWALDQKKTEILLRLNAALFSFWVYKSPVNEAEDWLKASLALACENQVSSLRWRAKVLNVAGYSAIMSSDLKRAMGLFEEGLALYSRLDEKREIAWSLRGCGFVAMIAGNFATARPYLERSLEICRAIQDEWGMAWSRYDIGYLALVGKNLVEANPMIENARAGFHQLGVIFGVFRSTIALGDVLRLQEQWRQAAAYYGDAMLIQQQNQFRYFLSSIYEGLAQIALACRNPERAANLLGAAQKRRETNELPRWAHQEADYHRGLAQLREQLSPEAISKAWSVGYALSAAEAFADALDYVREKV